MRKIHTLSFRMGKSNVQKKICFRCHQKPCQRIVVNISFLYIKQWRPFREQKERNRNMKKEERLAEFYKQCVSKGYTDMHVSKRVPID